MTPEQEVLADHLMRCARLVASFEADRSDYATLFPLDTDIEELRGAAAHLSLSFIKQFELLVEYVNRRLIRSIAAVRGIKVQSVRLLELTQWASVEGILPDPGRWADIIQMRNVLAHEYLVPMARYRPVANDAWHAVDDVLATIAAVRKYVDDHDLLVATEETDDD